MNYLKILIENKEKEYFERGTTKQKKAFIFIVHLVRIFDYELKNFEQKSEKQQQAINDKILKETISLLSGYYQIFIDNLNGDSNLNLDNIIKMKSRELFDKYIDIDQELIQYFSKSLSYMRYNFSFPVGKLNKSNYVNKLINYVTTDDEFRKCINDCIMKQISNQGNIIEKIFKESNSVNEEDIDIVNIIQNFLSNIYKENLDNFCLKAEKDCYFSSLLFNEEIKNFNSKENQSFNRISSIILDIRDDEEEINFK